MARVFSRQFLPFSGRIDYKTQSQSQFFHLNVGLDVRASPKVLLNWQKIAGPLMIIAGVFWVSSCTTGRWVQAGKTEDDIQRDLKDCEDFISQEEGVDLLPEQYTSTRYWEREPPLKSSQEDVVARAMRKCMEEKGYQFQRN